MKQSTKKADLAPKENGQVKLPETPKENPLGYYVPYAVYEQVLLYIGKGPYLEVKPLMEYVTGNSQAVYPKNIEKNETENNTTPDA